MGRIILVCCILCLQVFYVFGLSFMEQKFNKRVCVIGAGIAGLTSAKHLKDEGIDFTVLESTKYVGGTWRYDPRVGTDENGLPLHSSMYKHLRTNLPKPTMELRGFPLPDDMPSFPSWEHYYEYLKAYAKHFDLYKHIKFLHNVVLVRRENNVWKVKHKHVVSGEEYENDYDFLIVGTGHNSKPKVPSIHGENLFKGKIIHSHDYKEPEPYRNRRVLVIGGGPSSVDISMEIIEVSRTLVHSYHRSLPTKTKYPENYIKKSDVKEFNETGAIFADGTFEELDDVIYCTGFEYYYPFLDKSTELTVTPNSVMPLYKHTVNINQPSMVVLGLALRACLIVALEAQARYATALVKGNFTLPSQEDMMAEWQTRYDEIKAKGRPLSDLHILGRHEDQYYASLTAESGIYRVPPVLFQIRNKDMEAKMDDLYTYKNYEYIVLDDHKFTRRIENPNKHYTVAP